MNLLSFTKNQSNYRYAILIKSSSLRRPEIQKYYLDPLVAEGVLLEEIAVVGLDYEPNNKIPIKLGRERLTRILSSLNSLKIETIYIADTNYFKIATKKTKTAGLVGSVFQCALQSYEHMKIVLGVNYQAMYYNDTLEPLLTLSLNTFAQEIQQRFQPLGQNLIHNSEYPDTIYKIRDALEKLHQYPMLTCDIETQGLRLQQGMLATISFAWDAHNGIAFNCKLAGRDLMIRQMLRKFFEDYKGRLVFHHSLFDVKVLIFEVFMTNLQDQINLRQGLKAFSNIIDTQVITYIATNTTAGNKLNLKENALEFTGNYAQEDINDISLIPMAELLEYNLTDALATWYVLKKYKPIVEADSELVRFYKEIAQPTLIPTIKMMLTGLPVDMVEVQHSKQQLLTILDKAQKLIKTHPAVTATESILGVNAALTANQKLKKLYKTSADFPITFNPGSHDQVRILLYDVLKFPVLEYTKKKAPSTSSKALKLLIGTNPPQKEKELLEALLDVAEVNILLNTFIFAIESYSHRSPDGTHWILIGDLKSTGTQSGRYASANPNMQNLPNNTRLAKLIKRVFVAPKGWLIGGADFSSLEDRINAVLTNDPNKIKVYTDGYDGHSLRAFSYFNDSMPDIIDTVESINSIEQKYPTLRQRSKGPTFALTYEGTWKTLVKNIGLAEDEAKRIEENYHELYKVSDAFSQQNIESASINGFVRLAFGARLKTPILSKTILNSAVTPHEAEKEGRSANNAITQSWGMLTNRAIIEFEERLERSKFRYDIRICNVVHDAIYLWIKDDSKVVRWVNKNLIECMEWNEDPKIKSVDVPMKAELTVGKSLDKQHKIPNRIKLGEIEKILCQIQR